MNTIVICRDDKNGLQKGRYVLATRTVFPDRVSASIFAQQISPSRQARLVTGAWEALKTDPEVTTGFALIARGRRAGRQKGHYALALPRTFQSRREALLSAGGLPSKTEPLVIFGNWNELRLEAVAFFLAT